MIGLLIIAIRFLLFIILGLGLILASLMVAEIVLDSLGRDCEKVEHMIEEVIPPFMILALILLNLLLAYIVILGV